MPINISDKLPAARILEKENIFFMRKDRAIHQDIRPLEIAIFNLMPDKITTEIQLLRLIGNTPLQINVTFIKTKTHKSKNVSKKHLKEFYKTFDEIKYKKFDGLIVTGAPIEHLKFEEINYWEELKEVLDWSKKNVTSTLFICWAAQAALYYFYGIQKYVLPKKLFGVFLHKKSNKHFKLLRGFDDEFFVPHSRFTTVRKKDLEKIKEIDILAESKEAGVYLAKAKKNKFVFVTGHSEYDFDTLKKEYKRDKKNSLNIEIPKNYFPNNNINKKPLVKWKSNAHLLFSNWLNYYVYQQTPFELE